MDSEKKEAGPGAWRCQCNSVIAVSGEREQKKEMSGRSQEAWEQDCGESVGNGTVKGKGTVV